MKTPATTLRTAMRAKFPPERLARVIAELPLAERVELKRLFTPKLAKTITRIRRKK